MAPTALGLSALTEHKSQSDDDQAHPQQAQHCQLVAEDQVIHHRRHRGHQIEGLPMQGRLTDQERRREEHDELDREVAERESAGKV